MKDTATTSKLPVPRVFLWSPALDFLLGAGGVVAPLLLLLVLLGRAPSSMPWVVGAAAGLSLWASAPHLAATVLLAWQRGAKTRRWLVVTAVTFVVVGVVASHSHDVQSALLWVWSFVLPFHMVHQNAAVSQMWLQRSWRETPTRSLSVGDQAALLVAHGLVAVLWVTRLRPRPAFLLGDDDDALPLLPSTVGPFPGPIATWWACGLALAAAAALVVVLVRLWRQGVANRDVLFVVVAWTSSVVVWLVQVFVFDRWNLLPPLAFFALTHGVQALWRAQFAAAREAHDRGRSFDGLAFAGVVVAGGVALLQVVPWGLSRLAGVDLAHSLLLVAVVVDLHHIVVDSILWRGAEPQTVRWCMGDGCATARREHVSNARALGWLLAIFALVAVGVVDVVQTIAVCRGSGPTLLTMAEKLAPADARVWTRRAEEAAFDGDVDLARAHLGRALALSPGSAEATLELTRVHLASGHLTDARALWSAAPVHVRSSANGMLVEAQVALGHRQFDDARAAARRALATRELPEELDLQAREVWGIAALSTSQPAAALHVLVDALLRARAVHEVDDALAAGYLLAGGLALAKAHEALGQSDPVFVVVDRLLAGSEAAHRPDVAVQALLLRAAAHLHRQDARGALEAFQRALRVAEAAGPVTTTLPWQRDVTPVLARGWLDYATLLSRSAAPARARATCVQKAEQLVHSLSKALAPERTALLASLTPLLTEHAASLSPDDMASVRADLAGAVREVLDLRYPAEASNP
jgi:tetratricopeptide (TPR) repeat protein